MTLAERIKELRCFLKTDEIYARFIEKQLCVTKKELQVPGVAQPGDARDWWYLAEGRMGRACSLYAITGDESLADWVHQSALMLARESADAWIGPFFRTRCTPLKGTLETGHLAAAVAQPLIFTLSTYNHFCFFRFKISSSPSLYFTYRRWKQCKRSKHH